MRTNSFEMASNGGVISRIEFEWVNYVCNDFPDLLFPFECRAKIQSHSRKKRTKKLTNDKLPLKYADVYILVEQVRKICQGNKLIAQQQRTAHVADTLQS